jgi:hypothetical protein
MNTPTSTSHSIDRSRIARLLGMSAFLMGAILAGRIAACDFCLRLPRVPFEFDHQAAIEVVLATQAAAELGEIDLNPDVRLTASNDNNRTTSLSEISPRQLITRWVRTRPAANIRSLRCSLEVIFVDVDYAGSLDIRVGEILEGNQSHGPADIRLMTTKAGFCHLLDEGLAVCEQRQLVAVEFERPVNREDLQRLFATHAKPIHPDEMILHARVSSRPQGVRSKNH